MRAEAREAGRSPLTEEGVVYNEDLGFYPLASRWEGTEDSKQGVI